MHAVLYGATHNVRIMLRKLIHDGRLTLLGFREIH